ncbi:MAG: restriction endonuclease [Anaerolineales bacterium]|nr:restriction endonuclease [Anaerolineales bacterium]MCZ2121472.1 restriction endonuclease [Anaerolineales bacterium]
MARRGSFTSLMNQIAREAARSEQERLTSKEAKQQYLENRVQKTKYLNNELAFKVEGLKNILEHALKIYGAISFDILKINDEFPKFKLPLELQKEPVTISKEEFFSKIPKPTSLEKLIPGWEKKYQATLQEAKGRYEEYEVKVEIYVAERNKKISDLQIEYSKEKEAFEQKKNQRNQEVIEFESAYKNADPTAVSSYCTMVLERSEYPDDFPQEFRVAYLPEPKEVVIEYELPHKSIVPTTLEYKYTKTKDVIDEKPRKVAEIKEIYQDIVSAICLRTIHELVKADQNNNLDVIVFNGFVNDIDPATGKDIRPCLISIRTTKDKFQEINLGKVDKKACLRNLGAQVSPRPDELMAVKPIVEFDMVDKRFVEGSDILSDLENRPNLMELTPFEFENLVNNLFDRIGFDSKSTQASRDGGVDVVAFDPRPILGGKVVIQAKRYKNVVGVSAVRDLYGTMINEGANKGILVATSHYGKDAYEFAKDKPIELIDGGGLLYLLEENGVKARIIFPEG